MIRDQLEARAARWPEAPLRVLVPGPIRTLTCEGDEELYRSEPTSSAISHLRQAWAAVAMARGARERARANARRRRPAPETGGAA